MTDELDKMLGGLTRGTERRQTSQSALNEIYYNPQTAANTNVPEAQQAMTERVDALFGRKYGGISVKTEKPEHRLMLWLKLNGHSNKEVAATTGYNYVYVCNIVKQPWFTEAFCRLSSEMGKDAVQTFLKGEVMGALERTVEIAKNGDSDSVKLAANKEVLDRFLGKSVVKAEVKTENKSDVVVHTVAELLEEQRKLDLQLASNGIGFTPSRS